MKMILGVCILLALIVCAAGAEEMIPAGDTHVFMLDVPQTGDYYLQLTYSCKAAGAFSGIASMKLNGQIFRISLPMLWEDQDGELRTDKYGNEIAPDQQLKGKQITELIRDYTRYTGMPIVFTLNEGNTELTITPENIDVLMYKATVFPAREILDYKSYLTVFNDATAGQDHITLEAEEYTYKNDSFIRGTSSKNTTTVPYDELIKRISIIEDKSFSTVGQTLYYEFDITDPGMYTLAFKYCQPLKAGMPVFRTILVDGEVPYAELKDVAFRHTGLNQFENLIISQKIYLAQGHHTLAIRTTAGPIDAMYAEIMDLICEMNSVTLKIKKLTGQNSDVSSNVDKNRTWDILEYLPAILGDLSHWQEQLEAIYQQLKNIGGQDPGYASDIKLAIKNLRELQKEPSKIPGKITLLADDSSSAAQLLGTLLPKLSEQNLSLDCIYIYNGDTALPNADESLLASVGAGLKQFLYSFSPLMNESVSRQQDGSHLTVWVNKSSQYVEVLREMCARTFTKDTGIDVTFSIMPGEDKIILANASGTNPDVALCINYYLPFSFAVRGMAKNLLEYDGFLDFYTSQYTLESLVPMSYDKGVYAASDSQDFYVLFYRKDILESLGLDVPQTMDEIRAMMPTLHRNAMNFSMPLSTDKEGYKGFSQTLPFIYQNGGDFYSEDGMHGGLTNPLTVKGLKEMCDLYRVYGCMINIKSFFNSFRSGSVPIGISNFSTYLQLSVTAPEMTGLWDIALAPGTMDEKGSILRYHSGDSTAAMIFENTAMPIEAYQFLLWWLDSNTQTQYANDLQRKYGPNYLWNTANLTAFEFMPYPKAHKDVILTMWRDWQKETPRHIASYMLEREISNIWMDVVRDGKPFHSRVDEAQTNIDREMVRKMEEFGYLDTDGKVLRPYIVDSIDKIREGTK